MSPERGYRHWVTLFAREVQVLMGPTGGLKPAEIESELRFVALTEDSQSHGN